jgi:hypothetical protein
VAINAAVNFVAVLSVASEKNFPELPQGRLKLYEKQGNMQENLVSDNTSQHVAP